GEKLKVLSHSLLKYLNCQYTTGREIFIAFNSNVFIVLNNCHSNKKRLLIASYIVNIYYCDHGGSTLLPPNVTNEFPEYGTMEGGGEGLRASLEFDAESLLRCPGALQGAQPLASRHSGPVGVAGGPKDVRGLPSQSHFKEPSLQPIDSLISALKATEARIASGTLQATKVLDGAAVSRVSTQQGGQEPDPAGQKAAKAHAPFPAGREKSPDIPLSAKVPTEEHFYLSIQEDLTALLTGETQAEPSLRASNGRKGAVHVQEPAGPASSVGSPATHSSAGGAGLLRERRADQCARGRPAPGKHVAFQGVETLWTGGEEREARHPADVQTSPGRTAPPGSREFSQVPSHLVSSAALRDSAPPERPGPPAPLLESVEDEVFLREEKDHVERRPEPERVGERTLEQAEHLRGGDDDILGSGYAEDSTDMYSSQFETILDNTSLYYSAESLETLYSEPDSYFSFEMPLTPMIQQRIKEGGQFLERTSLGGQQDVLSISADGGIVMGYSSGVTNGLSGSSNSIYAKGTPEIAFWGRVQGCQIAASGRSVGRVSCIPTGKLGPTQILWVGMFLVFLGHTVSEAEDLGWHHRLSGHDSAGKESTCNEETLMVKNSPAMWETLTSSGTVSTSLSSASSVDRPGWQEAFFIFKSGRRGPDKSTCVATVGMPGAECCLFLLSLGPADRKRGAANTAMWQALLFWFSETHSRAEVTSSPLLAACDCDISTVDEMVRWHHRLMDMSLTKLRELFKPYDIQSKVLGVGVKSAGGAG
ncbi:hypothetical protein FD755_014774, partial [Muntiacus reevesi]